jgi:hypothetical protein
MDLTLREGYWMKILDEVDSSDISRKLLVSFIALLVN